MTSGDVTQFMAEMINGFILEQFLSVDVRFSVCLLPSEHNQGEDGQNSFEYMHEAVFLFIAPTDTTAAQLSC